MSSEKKNRNWKLFAALCVIVAAASLWGFWSRPAVPPLDPALLSQARALRLDLAADAKGREQTARIAESASGASSRDQKDARLAGLTHEFAAQGYFNAACEAAIRVSQEYKRDGLLAEIARNAAADCATLPWGALALKHMRGRGVQIDAVLLLNARLRQCAGQSDHGAARDAAVPPAARSGPVAGPETAREIS